MRSGELNTRRVDTKDNLADILTKALARAIHDDLRERMGVKETGGVRVQV